MKLARNSAIYRLAMWGGAEPPKDGCDVLLRVLTVAALSIIAAIGIAIYSFGLLLLDGLLFQIVTKATFAVELPQTLKGVFVLAMLGAPILLTQIVTIIAIVRFLKTFSHIAHLLLRGLKLLGTVAIWATAIGVCSFITGPLVYTILGAEPAGAPGSLDRLTSIIMTGLPVVAIGSAAAYIAASLLKGLCRRIELPK